MDERTIPPLNNVLPMQSLSATTETNREEINGNELFKEAMEALDTDFKRSASIMRIDSLPTIYGNRQQLVELFTALLTMIVDHPPLKSKLFLYLKCTEEEKDHEVIDLRLDKEEVMYCFSFHTNITTDDSWKLIHKHTLAWCKEIAVQNKGEFLYQDICNTGCLFTLSLPGKI
jgi:hypothetical protein